MHVQLLFCYSRLCTVVAVMLLAYHCQLGNGVMQLIVIVMVYHYQCINGVDSMFCII